MEVKTGTYFSSSECLDIIKLSESINSVPRDKEMTSHLGVHFNINYDSYNIERVKSTQWIFDRIHNFIEVEHKLKILKELNTLHLHKYSVGHQFTKHRDNYYANQYMNVGVCLNTGYDGGEFVVYEPYQTIPKQTGSVYSFNNSRLHEIKKITKGIRWSIIGFVLADNVKLTSYLF